MWDRHSCKPEAESTNFGADFHKTLLHDLKPLPGDLPRDAAARLRRATAFGDMAGEREVERACGVLDVWGISTEDVDKGGARGRPESRHGISLENGRARSGLRRGCFNGRRAVGVHASGPRLRYFLCGSKPRNGLAGRWQCLALSFRKLRTTPPALLAAARRPDRRMTRPTSTSSAPPRLRHRQHRCAAWRVLPQHIFETSGKRTARPACGAVPSRVGRGRYPVDQHGHAQRRTATGSQDLAHRRRSALSGASANHRARCRATHVVLLWVALRETARLLHSRISSASHGATFPCKPAHKQTCNFAPNLAATRTQQQTQVISLRNGAEASGPGTTLVSRAAPGAGGRARHASS